MNDLSDRALRAYESAADGAIAGNADSLQSASANIQKPEHHRHWGPLLVHADVLFCPNYQDAIYPVLMILRSSRTFTLYS
jgi:hypothetical protein